MRLDAIRSFITVVEEGSYAAAAESLYTSPTTLHSHVKSIQDELAVPLMTFSGRRLELTAAGHQFLLFAQQVIVDYDTLTQDITNRVRPERSKIRVVSPHGPAVHLIPPVVRDFEDDHEDLLVMIETSLKGESIAALASNQADIAVLNDVASVHHLTDVFEVATVYEDRLVAIIDHDISDASGTELFSRYPVAAQPSGSPSRQYFERWARENSVAADVKFEHSTFDGIKSYVMDAGCIGIVSEYIVKTAPDPGRLRIIDLPDFELPRRIVALYHPRPSARVASFVEALSSYYRR